MRYRFDISCRIAGLLMKKGIKVFYPLRLFCDFTECIDSVIDWFSKSQSSQSKNIHRQEVGRYFYPTFLLKVAVWLFELKLNRFDVLTAFYKRPWLSLQCPIHLAWRPFLK